MSGQGSLTKHQQEQISNVGEMFSSLDKLVRGFQLYEGKGALVERLLKDLFTKSSKALDDIITVRMTPVGPMLHGESVIGDSQPPKYLFQLFCDGIRELTFHPGLNEEELEAFVDVFLQDYTSSEDDMVTTLWKKDLRSIRYYAVDTLGMQAEEDASELSVQESQQLASSGEEGEEMTLSASDIRLLKAEDSLGWVRRCKAPAEATGAAKDIAEKIIEKIELSKDWKRFVAIALRVEGETEPMIINMVSSLVQQSSTDDLIAILESISDLAGEEIDTASSLLSSVLSRELLADLAPLFEENPQAFLAAFRRGLQLEGYESDGLVELLKSLPLGDAREELQQLLIDEGMDMTPFYLDSLTSEDTDIVCSALKALGKIGTGPALSAISKSLTNSLADIRIQALKALSGRYTAEARPALVKALNDTEEDIRLQALEILASSGERMIGSSLLGVVLSGDFGRRSELEQRAFIVALAKFPTPRVTGYYSDILSEKNLTRNKSIISKQKFVIEALEQMESPDAKGLLEQVGKSWFLPADLKEAANAAAAKK